MNNIYFQDFGSLKSESLRIDYLRWNLVPLKPDQIYKAASYFKTLGFNACQKDRNNSKSRQEITFDRRNLYEVVFILKINYQEGTFCGLVAIPVALSSKLTKITNNFNGCNLRSLVMEI